MRANRAAAPALRRAEATGQARQAGLELGFGEPLKVYYRYQQPATTTCLRGLGCLVCFGAFCAALVASTVVPVQVAGCAFAVFLVATIAGALLKKVRSWLARYADGYAQLRPPGSPRAVRWADVTAVSVHYRRVTSGGTPYSAPTTRTVIDGFDAGPSLTEFAPETWGHKAEPDLAADALRAVGPRLAARLIADYDAGRPAVFGQIRIDQAGLTLPAKPGRGGDWPGGLVPWQAITAVSGESSRLPGNRMLVHTITVSCTDRPKHRRISLSQVPNGIVLPAVLQHAAARCGIRARQLTFEP